MATQACSCEREIDTPFVPSFSMAMLLRTVRFLLSIGHL